MKTSTHLLERPINGNNKLQSVYWNKRKAVNVKDIRSDTKEEQEHRELWPNRQRYCLHTQNVEKSSFWELVAPEMQKQSSDMA